MCKLVCTIIALSTIFFGSPAMAALYELSPTDDAMIYQQFSDTNYGSATSLGSAMQFMSPRAYGLLKFSMPVMEDEVVESTTLFMYQMNGGGYGEGPTALLHSSNNSWSEETVTWNNASAGPLTSLAVNKDGHSHRGWSTWSFQWNYDFGNLVTLWLGENSSGDQSHNWYSKEDQVPGRRPYLLVVTNPASFVDYSDVSPEHWGWLYIRTIRGAGYTTGYGGTNEFKPDYEVTRDQMAAFIVRAKEGEPPADYCDGGCYFSDVVTSGWACKYIQRLYEMGTTTGYEGTDQYRPELSVTRDQMAAFIIRAIEGEPAADYCDSGSPFSDVPSTSWSCKYIKRLYEKHITTGYGGTDQYRPDLTVTRAQMAAFIGRAFLGMK
jgi:hypothetical protein